MLIYVGFICFGVCSVLYVILNFYVKIEINSIHLSIEGDLVSHDKTNKRYEDRTHKDKMKKAWTFIEYIVLSRGEKAFQKKKKVEERKRIQKCLYYAMNFCTLKEEKGIELMTIKSLVGYLTTGPIQLIDPKTR